MIVDDGQWWLPTDPDRTAVGNLITDDDGALRLELDRRLVRWTGGAAVVWGRTADSIPVTLLGVLPFGRVTQEEIYVRVALVGAHVASDDDAIFSHTTVNLSNLTDWATRGRVAPPLPVRIDHPEKPGEQLSLRRAGDDVQLVIDSEKPRRWAGFDSTIQDFQDLLTLAGTADCRIESTVLDTVDGTPVQVWVKPDRVIERRWLPVFVLGTVPSGFISDWLTLRAQLGMSGSVLFSLDYGGRGYFQNKLFNAASAAEGFHQALRPDTTGIPDQEHKALKRHVQAFPSGPTRQWALAAISGNRPGFATRMRELASIPDNEAVVRVLHDEAKWVTWMAHARNAIGHSSWDGMDKVPPEVRQALTHVTRTLLHLVILQELGFTAEHQRNAAMVIYSELRQRYDDYF